VKEESAVLRKFLKVWLFNTLKLFTRNFGATIHSSENKALSRAKIEIGRPFNVLASSVLILAS